MSCCKNRKGTCVKRWFCRRCKASYVIRTRDCAPQTCGERCIGCGYQVC